MIAQGIVASPAAANNADGAIVSQMMGKQGEALMSEVHGKWYNAAIRGNLFIGSTAAAGTTVPVSSATAATFTLYNPIGSGVNVELVRYNAGSTTTTLVAGGILLGLASNLIVAPTSVTALTTRAALLGGNAAAKARLYSVATIVATTDFYTMFSVSATSGLGPNFSHDFDGSVVLAPGSLAHVCAFAAQTQTWDQTFVWAEWPAA